MVIGCDISLNHGGFCWFDVDGQVVEWKFFHDVKKYISAEPTHGVFTGMKKRPDETSHAYDVRRLVNYLGMFNSHVLCTHVPNRSGELYFSIEGYAIGQGSKNTNRLLQIAELTGTLKNQIYTYGGLMRIHDPKTVKMYACHGSATKTVMREAASQDGFELPDSLFKVKKVKGKPDDLDGPGTDVIDAYWLGKMLVMELKLRAGEAKVSDLPPHQIQMFNRVTKTFPVNVLCRPFVGDDE